jgi:cell division protein FtsB
MEQAAYEHWWQLHLRTARGEKLPPDEQSVYEAGRHELEQEERFCDAIGARAARDHLAMLEAEYAELEARRQQLDAEILSLESRLNEQTRHYLGIEA